METEPIMPDFSGVNSLQFCNAIQRDKKSAQGNDKRRKQKEPKKKFAELPPVETDNDKCGHHKEIQKRIKMTNGRISFLEHCIKSEKEFPDLTDDDALIGYQKEHEELSSLKEHKLGELALILLCPVLDSPENANNSIKQNDPREINVKKHSRQMSYVSGPAHQIENKIPAPHFYGRARSEPRLPRYLSIKKVLLPGGAGRHF
ncbi:hypothetical protein TNCV_876041 [Trichonephila clavipes]|nr:hypothetical protein TNCV_876041 [Trichonephila clavipes]